MESEFSVLRMHGVSECCVLPNIAAVCLYPHALIDDGCAHLSVLPLQVRPRRRREGRLERILCGAQETVLVPSPHCFEPGLAPGWPRLHRLCYRHSLLWQCCVSTIRRTCCSWHAFVVVSRAQRLFAQTRTLFLHGMVVSIATTHTHQEPTLTHMHTQCD